jgi:hypothetical protein
MCMSHLVDAGNARFAKIGPLKGCEQRVSTSATRYITSGAAYVERDAVRVEAVSANKGINDCGGLRSGRRVGAARKRDLAQR